MVKRIIDGVTYNTATATKIAASGTPYDIEETDGREEAEGVLYQTRGGAIFLHERFPKFDHEEGEWRTAHKITPMTEQEAQDWVMLGDVELYADVFGSPPEAEAEAKPGATIYVRVPATLKARADEAARDEKLSTNAWALRCLEKCAGQVAMRPLTLAHYIASVQHLDRRSVQELEDRLDEVRLLIEEAWDDLGLPREKGKDVAEDITLASLSYDSEAQLYRDRWPEHG